MLSANSFQASRLPAAVRRAAIWLTQPAEVTTSVRPVVDSTVASNAASTRSRNAPKLSR